MVLAAAAFPLPRSVSKPLLDPRDSLSLFAADYAARTSVASVTIDPISWRTALKSVAEAVRSLPKIEKPGDKGDGLYVERTLMDAFLPLNATISVVRGPPTIEAHDTPKENDMDDIAVWLTLCAHPRRRLSRVHVLRLWRL